MLISLKLIVEINYKLLFQHSKGFIHRDIKAENVFYSGPNYVKLGDFGFSTQLTKGEKLFLFWEMMS